MILIDSNILIDVLDDRQEWFEWSSDQLTALSAEHRTAVNQIAFAEVAPRMGGIAPFERRLAEFEIAYEAFGEAAAFAAGSAFLEYRRNRGTARMLLPDFLIGGHAQVTAASILTRDARFYRAYFPTVPLITPDKAPA